jgi:dTDP-glucose 4,6-dehydratase
LDAHFAIGNFIRDAMRGEPIRVKDGTPYRSYLYAADLAIWLWTIIFKGASCHPYNVGSDQEITIADLARTVASVLGGSVQEYSTPHPLTPSTASLDTSTPNFNLSPSRYVPSVECAQSELALHVLISLHQSIQRTTAWHQNNQ